MPVYSAQDYPDFTREHVPNFRPDVFTHSGPEADLSRYVVSIDLYQILFVRYFYR